MTPEREAARAALPGGGDYEVVQAHGGWRVQAGGPCRYTVGPGHAQCKRPGVAQLRRGPTWWNYCDTPGHMFGRWVEGDRVVQWRRIFDAEESQGGPGVPS